MLKKIAVKTVILGVLGCGLLFGGSGIAGAQPPVTQADGWGCYGWNGPIARNQWCGGPGRYPYWRPYPPPPPPLLLPPPVWVPPYGGPPIGYPCRC